jgi:hypothetical protein
MSNSLHYEKSALRDAVGSLQLVRVNHDDFCVFDPGDLDLRNIRDCRVVARPDAQASPEPPCCT